MEHQEMMHTKVLIGVIVGMVLLAATVCLLSWLGKTHTIESNRTWRAKYEACQSMETELNRVACLNNWGGY